MHPGHLALTQASRTVRLVLSPTTVPETRIPPYFTPRAGARHGRIMALLAEPQHSGESA